MLGRIFIALCGVPGFKKLLWRTWYDYLARSQRLPEWTFMNYGYAAGGVNPLVLNLDARDEPDRNWIQLYHHVAGTIDLQGATVLANPNRGTGTDLPCRVTARVSLRVAVDNAVRREHQESIIR